MNISKKELIIWVTLLMAALLISRISKLERDVFLRKKEITISNRIVLVKYPESQDSTKASFIIINSGSNRLIIKHVDLDCNCSGYSLDKHVIVPLDTANLVVRIKDIKMGFTRTVTLHCNTYDSPVLLKIIGMTMPGI